MNQNPHTKLAVQIMRKLRVSPSRYHEGIPLFVMDAQSGVIGWPNFGRWLDVVSGQCPGLTFWLGADADKEPA